MKANLLKLIQAIICLTIIWCTYINWKSYTINTRICSIKGNDAMGVIRKTIRTSEFGQNGKIFLTDHKDGTNTNTYIGALALEWDKKGDPELLVLSINDWRGDSNKSTNLTNDNSYYYETYKISFKLDTKIRASLLGNILISTHLEYNTSNTEHLIKDKTITKTFTDFNLTFLSPGYDAELTNSKEFNIGDKNLCLILQTSQIRISNHDYTLSGIFKLNMDETGNIIVSDILFAILILMINLTTAFVNANLPPGATAISTILGCAWDIITFTDNLPFNKYCIFNSNYAFFILFGLISIVIQFVTLENVLSKVYERYGEVAVFLLMSQICIIMGFTFSGIDIVNIFNLWLIPIWVYFPDINFPHVKLRVGLLLQPVSKVLFTYILKLRGLHYGLLETNSVNLLFDFILFIIELCLVLLFWKYNSCLVRMYEVRISEANKYSKVVTIQCDGLNECTICLEPMNSEINKIVAVSCMHKYHKDCLITWLEVQAKCPQCRADILLN
jgi:hypothetical protein